MMVPRHAAVFLLALPLVLSPLRAQAPAFEKAKDALRESMRKTKVAERLAGIREIADAKDVRGVDDLMALVRTQEQIIEKKREEIERLGKENREIWKTVDDQGSKGRELPAGATERAIARAKDLQAKLGALNAELLVAEATRAALHEGLGRLLGGVDASARAPKVLELASAAQKAASFEDKLVFIRVFAAIRAPESRDALIEMARLSQDGQVRTAAVTALGEQADPTSIATLGEALKDETWSVKTAAALAIAPIPTLDGVTALAAAITASEGGTTDAIVRALEDVTGVTFFDNAALWNDWFSKEGIDLKAALANLDSGEPSIRMAAMTTIAAKGPLAGVRLLVRQEGVDPARDARAKFKISDLARAETRPATKEEIETRRAAIGRAITSRPKAIRDRAIAALFLEPAVKARELDDDVTEEGYIRAASCVAAPAVLAMLTRYADRIPYGDSAAAEERLRRAAIEALGWQDQDDAVVALGRLLKEDKTSKEAKELACAALERLHREACVPPLIEALLAKGAIAEAAARSLKALTGADHGVDRTAWNTWWNEKGRETTSLAKRRSDDDKPDEEKAEGERRGTSFYGINTRSKKLLYVLDISGSMNFGEIKGATGGGRESRIQVAKKELKSSIAALPEDALFDIIVFADGVQIWKPKLQTASKAVKAEAVKWVDDIKAIGATNIFDALERAFELCGRGTTDKRYTLLVDTIMLLSDGAPNRGRIVDPNAIIAEVARMNEYKKVCIHTVGVGKDHNAELMKRLARLNGGTYIARDKE